MQAQILMMEGTFSAASSITVSVTPESPPASPPVGMVQDGNAYRITATSAGENLEPAAGTPVTVALRGTGASSSLTMYEHGSNGWQPLRTFNLGCGFTFESVSTKLGDFALFRVRGAVSSGGFPVAVLVGVLAVLVIVATLGLARLNVRRRR